jgi:hypothetical protein
VDDGALLTFHNVIIYLLSIVTHLSFLIKEWVVRLGLAQALLACLLRGGVNQKSTYCIIREGLVKGKVKYSYPPCTN